MYVTEEDGKTLLFDETYHQTFFHDVKRNHGMPEYVVVSDFINSDPNVREIGLEIMLYLKQFGFATKDMLITMLNAKNLDVSVLDSLLDSYVEKYILNYFILAKVAMNPIPEDAMKIYCIDTGAIYILTHFSSSDTVSWLSSDNLRSATLVSKYLLTGQFASILSQNKGSALASFSPLFDVSISRRMIRFSAQFTIMNGFTPLNYLMETVRAFDLPAPWMKKCGEQIAPFSRERYWQKCFDLEPTYVLLCEDQETATTAGIILNRYFDQQQKILLVTNDFLQGNPDSIFCIDPETKLLIPTVEKSFLSE